MPKGNTAKIRALNDALKVVTTVNVPTGTKQLYLALFKTDPKNDGSGTEESYSGYTREAISFGTPALNGNVAEVKNSNAIEFGTVPSASGTIGWAAIYTELTGGILLYHGSLGATYTLNVGVKPMVPIGNLTVNEN